MQLINSLISTLKRLAWYLISLKGFFDTDLEMILEGVEMFCGRSFERKFNKMVSTPISSRLIKRMLLDYYPLIETLKETVFVENYQLYEKYVDVMKKAAEHEVFTELYFKWLTLTGKPELFLVGKQSHTLKEISFKFA